MSIFQNYLFAIFITGVWVHVCFFILKKYISFKMSSYWSFIIGVVLLLPLLTIIVPFDIVIAKYLPSLLIWLVVDLVIASANKEKK